MKIGLDPRGVLEMERAMDLAPPGHLHLTEGPGRGATPDEDALGDPVAVYS